MSTNTHGNKIFRLDRSGCVARIGRRLIGWLTLRFWICQLRIQHRQSGQLLWRAPQGSGLKDTRTEPDASLGLRLMVDLIAPFAPDEML